MSMTPLPVRAVVPVIMLAVGTAACGGSAAKTASPTKPPAASTPSASAPAVVAGPTITIESFAFGAPLTVKAGTKITVKNMDSVGHTVTADDGTSFNASVDGRGTTTFAAPIKPGTYKFHCSIHPHMHSTLTVTS